MLNDAFVAHTRYRLHHVNEPLVNQKTCSMFPLSLEFENLDVQFIHAKVCSYC